MRLYGISLAVSAAALLVAVSAAGQQAVFDLSDDLRRVPVPAVDRAALPALVITGATMLDGKGARVPDAVVVIRGDRIVAAGRAGSVAMPPDVARTVDARGLFLMPGLIDLHVHLTSQRGADFGRYPDSDAAAAIRATVLAGSLVRAGITTIRDPATTGDVALRVKEAVARGLIEGPRVFWSGAMIATTGGHGDEATSTATGKWKPEVPNNRTYVANGAEGWSEAVRVQIRRQVDWIKVSAPFTREEIGAAVDEAHEHGLRVAIDSFGKYTDWAIEAGVDSVEHTLDMPKDEVSLLARHGTGFNPTLGAFRNLLVRGYPSAGIRPGAFFYTFSRRYGIDFAQNLGNVHAAWKAGVRIGVGTDIPFDTEELYPKAYFEELDYLHQAGLPNRAVLASATSVGADILGMGDRLGSIAPGMIADMILLAGDPEADLKALGKPQAVVSGGRLLFGPRGTN
ncbi:MAG: amidohydrolase family protein [Novosphingobium sp.]